MSQDGVFLIPKRDDDLFLESDNFFVLKRDANQEEVEENVNEFYSNVKEWWNILDYFPHFFYTIIQPANIAKETILHSAVVLEKGLSKLSNCMLSTLPDFLDDETPDESIVISITRIRTSLPTYIYLLSRLGAILEGEVLKCSNIGKSGKNSRDTFYDDFARARKSVVQNFENILTRKIGNTSAIKLLYSPDSIPEGIPRVVSHFIVKLLSVPENSLVRSEMRQLHPSFFNILAFMGFEWCCMKAVVNVFIDKIHTWEYFKKSSTFFFIQSILDLETVYCENFMDAILANFVGVEWSDSGSADKVRPFSLFINTLAEKHPDFVVKNFQSFWKFLRCDQHSIRCAVLSAIEAVILYYLRQNIQKENHDIISRLFHELQFFFWDPSSFVRIRAALVVSRILCESYLDDNQTNVIGDRTKRRFSSDFYAYNIIEKYAVLISDALVSVRRNAISYVNEILHRNIFGPDLDFNKLIAKYQEVVEERENLPDEPDNDEEIIAKLSERYERIKPVVDEYVREYFDLADFPELFEVPKSEDQQLATYLKLASDFEKEDDKRPVVYEAVNYCIQNGSYTSDVNDIEDIILFVIEKFHMRNLANMEIDNRAECIAEERQLQRTRQKDDLKRKEHDLLAAAQFSLQMEECMKNAISALKHAQMHEIQDIVKFLATCRQFKIRESESAVMQMCSLIYRNDADIRKYVVDAGKELFFSGNSNDAVSGKSTVQNLMQVLMNAKLEDRCVLSDTLVYIFKDKALPHNSLTFLWNSAEQDSFDVSTVAVQILQSYVRAVSSEGQKNFSRLIELLKRKNDNFQVEVITLASCCGTVIDSTNPNWKEMVPPKFRIPSTDEFFQLAIKQLIDQITVLESKRWNQRAKVTFHAMYEICETPDEFCNQVIGSILCRCKEINLQFRTFRYLYKESQRTLSSMRKKLNDNNVEVIPCYSTINDFELNYMQMTEEVQDLAFNNTQESIIESSEADPTDENTFLINIDPLRPSCYNGFKKFRTMKKNALSHCTASTETKELKWLQKSESAVDIRNRIKFQRNISVKHMQKVFDQTNDLYFKTRELHRQWHVLLKRLFFLTQQYIVRSISFIHVSMTDGLETLTRTLGEVRKLGQGEISINYNLPKWDGERLTPFERDNLTDNSIFKTNKGRMADATEQSTDAVVSSQVESAIGWDFFRPGSLSMRIWPLVMQILRFRSRPLISVALADSALFCLIKFMLASPNLCRRYLSFVFYYLRTAKPDTRNNIIIMLADIAIRHPSTFSKQLKPYLFMIYDNDQNVRYTSLLMIHYLYTVKAIQLDGQLRAHLAILLIDQKQYISDMTKHFFNEVIKNHHIPISSVINDVLLRLHTLKIKTFDFVPITEFFFSYIETHKEADQTMTILCKQLVNAASNRDADAYEQVFAKELIGCMKLIPKVSFNLVNTLDKTLDKFKVFLKKRSFQELMNELVKNLKRGHLKAEVKNEIDVLEKHLKSARKDVLLSNKFERTRRAGTIEPPHTVEEPMQID